MGKRPPFPSWLGEIMPTYWQACSFVPLVTVPNAIRTDLGVGSTVAFVVLQIFIHVFDSKAPELLTKLAD